MNRFKVANLVLEVKSKASHMTGKCCATGARTKASGIVCVLFYSLIC